MQNPSKLPYICIVGSHLMTAVESAYLKPFGIRRAPPPVSNTPWPGEKQGRLGWRMVEGKGISPFWRFPESNVSTYDI